MDSALQKRVMPLLHYALNHDGFLMLGSSENVGSASALFQGLDFRNRIFARNSSAVVPIDFNATLSPIGRVRAAGREDGPPLWTALDVAQQRQAETDRSELQHRLSIAQEEERRRLSRDLHDQVGQTLTALILEIQAARAGGQLPEAADERLKIVQHLAEDLGRQLHNFATQLRPTALDDLGLEPALRQLVADWQVRTGIPTNFQTTGLAAERFPQATETALFCVVQEALTNIARHAAAQRVGVIVALRDGHAVVIVEDDGRGFDMQRAVPPSSGKLGLIGMWERVTLAGGTLEIETHPNQGTTVYARIPPRAGHHPGR